MALPSKLKQAIAFNEGVACIGETVSITTPKLVRKMEAYRGGGMNRPVMIDMGGEPLEMEATYGGPMREILRQYGILNLSGVLQRFVGSFQNDDTGAIDTYEVVTRGRHEEIDLGEWKPGEETEFKVKSQLSYYKLTVNNVVEIEIDVLGMIEIVGGVDLMAEHRAALGF